MKRLSGGNTWCLVSWLEGSSQPDKVNVFIKFLDYCANICAELLGCVVFVSDFVCRSLSSSASLPLFVCVSVLVFDCMSLVLISLYVSACLYLCVCM